VQTNAAEVTSMVTSAGQWSPSAKGLPQVEPAAALDLFDTVDGSHGGAGHSAGSCPGPDRSSEKEPDQPRCSGAERCALGGPHGWHSDGIQRQRRALRVMNDRRELHGLRRKGEDGPP
jgi:hypothetical protein